MMTTTTACLEALRARIEQLLSRFPGHREVIIH